MIKQDYKVGIILTSFNNEDTIEKCLISLANQTYSNIEILLVDDSSKDNTVRVAKDVARVNPNVIFGNGEYYWTKSVNEGIKYYSTFGVKYLLLLNADCEINDNYIENFMILSQKLPNSFLGPVVTSLETGQIVYSAIRFNYFLSKGKYYKKLPDDYNQIDDLKYTLSDVLYGRGLWLPQNLIDKIGEFDEKNFPQYASDSEYTLRAKKKGIELYTVLNNNLITSTNRSQVNYDNAKGKKTFYEFFFSIKSPTYWKAQLLFAYKVSSIYSRFPAIVITIIRLMLSFLFQNDHLEKRKINNAV